MSKVRERKTSSTPKVSGCSESRNCVNDERAVIGKTGEGEKAISIIGLANWLSRRISPLSVAAAAAANHESSVLPSGST